MFRPAWLQPPRHLIGLFLAVTVVPFVLLTFFGWRLLLQDRELERQQIETRREQAADLAVASLGQTLFAVEQSLRAGAPVPELESNVDAVSLVFTPATVRDSPDGRLPYLPVPPSLAEAPPGVFAAGEA